MSFTTKTLIDNLWPNVYTFTRDGLCGDCFRFSARRQKRAHFEFTEVWSIHFRSVSVLALREILMIYDVVVYLMLMCKYMCTGCLYSMGNGIHRIVLSHYSACRISNAIGNDSLVGAGHKIAPSFYMNFSIHYMYSGSVVLMGSMLHSACRYYVLNVHNTLEGKDLRNYNTNACHRIYIWQQLALRKYEKYISNNIFSVIALCYMCSILLVL